MAELSMRRVKLSHRRMIYGNPRAIRYTDDRVSSDSALILKPSNTPGKQIERRDISRNYDCHFPRITRAYPREGGRGRGSRDSIKESIRVITLNVKRDFAKRFKRIKSRKVSIDRLDSLARIANALVDETRW